MDQTPQASKPPLTVVIPPPIWALLFVLVSWLTGHLTGASASFEQPVLGWIVIAAGAAFALWGRLTFAKAGTEIRPASAKNSHLVTSGPFRFTRNPMYLGLLAITLGIALVIGTPHAFAAPVVFFLWVNFISIPFEEAKMERQFGEAYRDYKRRVRRWI